VVSASLFGQRKFVIFDEADMMTIPLQNALKGLTEKFARHCGFLFTTNDATKIIEPLKSRCPVMDFDFAAEKRQLLALMIARAAMILQRERIAFDPDIVAQVVERDYPDFRRVVNALQRASLRGRLDVDSLGLEG
jgi:DNA polymerase III delta prime subunit